VIDSYAVKSADLRSAAVREDARTGRIEISCDAWPLVRIDYFGDVRLEALREAAQRYAELAERALAEGKRVSWLVNLNRFEPRPLDALRRRGASEILSQYTPRIAAGTLAEARVCESTLTRGVVTAVTWVVRQPWPTDIFATDREAVAWLEAQASRHAPRPG
jgi:hypothetical protein